MSKALLGIIPIIVIALGITFWLQYNALQDELIYSKNEAVALMHEKDLLTQAQNNDKQEIAKLTVQLHATQELLHERETKLQELQADVYSQFKHIEEIGKKNPSINALLRSTIPDSLWNEIYKQSNCDNPDQGDKADSANSPAPAVSGTSTKRQNCPVPD